jgi:glycosyltransferase involved in cell wall biosynthesis
MISIAVFTKKFYPEGSGGEVATYLILKYLSSEYKELSFSVFTGSKRYTNINRVSIKNIPLLNSNNIVNTWLSIIAHREYFFKLIEKFDIIYIPDFLYPLIDLAKDLNKKTVVHLHAYIPLSITSVVYKEDPFKYNASITTDMRRIVWYSFAQNEYQRLLLFPSALLLLPIRTWLEKADTIIVVSKKQREILSLAIPSLSKKLKVIYNPPPEINIERKELTDKACFLYLGGDSYIKGFQVLVEALYEVCTKNKLSHGVDFILANKYSPRHLGVVSKIAKLCRYDHKINVVGYVSHDELINLMKKSWGLLFPSHYEEPLSYAVVEALFAGTIPIASMVGGIEEITPAEFRKYLLVRPSASELVEKIEEVSSLQKNDIEELGYKLHEHVKKVLDIEAIKREFTQVFTG